MKRASDLRTSVRRVRGARRLVLLGCLAAVALVALLAAGCGGDEPAAEPTPSAGSITITDDAGQQLTLAKPAQRVVSLAPTQTELVFAVDGGDRLVGVSDFCDYPAEAQEIEKVGDFSSPNVERIVALEPDLVVAATGVQATVTERLAELGVPVAVLDPATLDGMVSDLQKLGALLGTEQRAQELADELGATIQDVEDKLAGVEPVAVFFEIYGKPLMTAGSGTMIEDIVTRAGGENIGSAAGEGFPEFSLEVLVREDPQVYIAVKGAQSDPGSIAKRAGYAQLSAVKDGRVFVMDDNLVVRSGPRAVEGLVQVAEYLHPDVFAASE